MSKVKDKDKIIEPITSKFINTTNETKSHFNEILKDLLDATNNLELKTEINKPINLAIFQSFANLLITKGYTNTGNFISDYIKLLMKYMISHKRQSRKEIISAIINLVQQEQEKLSGMRLFTRNLKTNKAVI